MRIERAKPTQAAVEEVGFLLVQMHREAGLAPINFGKLATAIHAEIRDGWVFNARSADGDLVGSIGLHKGEHWYSDDSFLCDRWNYVVIPHRRGLVGRALTEAAVGEAERQGLPLFIGRFNARGAAKRRGLVTEFVGFFPMGYEVKLR